MSFKEIPSDDLPKEPSEDPLAFQPSQPVYQPPPGYPAYKKIGKGMRLYGGYMITAMIIGFILGLILVVVGMGTLTGTSVDAIVSALKSTVVGAVVVSLIVGGLTFAFLGYFVFQIHQENQNLQSNQLDKTKLFLNISMVTSLVMIGVSILIMMRMINEIEILANKSTLTQADVDAFSAKTTIWNLILGTGQIIPLILDILAYRSLYNWGLNLERNLGYNIPDIDQGLIEVGPLTVNLKRTASGAILILVGSAAAMIPFDYIGLLGSIIDLAFSIVSIVGSVRVGTGLMRAGKLLDPQLS